MSLVEKVKKYIDDQMDEDDYRGDSINDEVLHESSEFEWSNKHKQLLEYASRGNDVVICSHGKRSSISVEDVLDAYDEIADKLLSTNPDALSIISEVIEKYVSATPVNLLTPEHNGNLVMFTCPECNGEVKWMENSYITSIHYCPVCGNKILRLKKSSGDN